MGLIGSAVGQLVHHDLSLEPDFDDYLLQEGVAL
jgi:hypothetical protein